MATRREPPQVAGLTGKEGVFLILAYTSEAMSYEDITRWLSDHGQEPLTVGQVAGGFYDLLNKYDRVVEKDEPGAYRIHHAWDGKPLDEQMRRDRSATSPARERRAIDVAKVTRMDEPDVAGLTGKEAVFRILAFTREPMRFKEIDNWLVAHGQEPLTVGQVAGGFYDLLNKYDKVVERDERGTYRIHRAWNGKPLDEQTRKDGAVVSSQRGKRGIPKVGIVIPCYGTYWDRNLVQWRNCTLLGKQQGEEAEVVDFSYQTGVYVLYQWPRVNYVGRTNSNLYQRLNEHASDDSKGPWDKFSWFGLRAVGEDGVLSDPEAKPDFQRTVAMMEALLISSLEPPFNRRAGDGMGAKYFQVPSSEIEEREQRKIAKAMERLFQKVRQGV